MFKRENKSKDQVQCGHTKQERSKSKKNELEHSSLISLIKQELPSKLTFSKGKAEEQDWNRQMASPPAANKTPLKSILKKTPTRSTPAVKNNQMSANQSSIIKVKTELLSSPEPPVVVKLEKVEVRDSSSRLETTKPQSSQGYSSVNQVANAKLKNDFNKSNKVKTEVNDDLGDQEKLPNKQPVLGKRQHSERKLKKERKDSLKKEKPNKLKKQFIDDEASEESNEQAPMLTEQVLKQQFYDESELKKETPNLNSVIKRIEARAKAQNQLEEDYPMLKKEEPDDYDSPDKFMEDFADQHNDVERDVTLPSNQDSKLWRLKVKPGLERQLVFRLTNKLFSKLNEGQPLMVLQVFECDNVPGVIYMEAHKLSHVEQLTRGISGVYTGKGSIRMIPISEMTDIMRQCSQMKENPVQKMQWVRVKKGIYQGDLGLVEHVLDSKKAIVRLVPRIPETWLDGSDEFEPKTYKQLQAKLKNQPHVRIAKKKFNPLQYHLSNSSSACTKEFFKPLQKSFKVWRDLKFRNGMIYLPISISKLSFEDNVCPSLEEVRQFQGHAFSVLKNQSASDSASLNPHSLASQQYDMESDLDEWDLLPDRQLVKTICQDKALRVQVGDQCRVAEGQFQGCQGTISKITQETGLATLMTNDKVSVPIKVQATLLEKVFSIGQGVRVLQGVYAGELGLIVDIKDDNETTCRRATVLMEAIKTELRIPISNLRRREQFDPKHALLADYFKSPHCNSLSTQGGLAQSEVFSAGDLVLLEGHMRSALVLQVQPDSLKVLYDSNKTGLVKVSEVSKKVNVETRGVNKKFLKRAPSCTDKFHNVITMKSLVKPTDRFCPFYKCIGEVRAIYKDQLFLAIQKSPNMHLLRATNGFFAIKCNEVCNVGHEQIQDAHQKSKFAQSQQVQGLIAGRADRRERDFDVRGKTIFIARGPLKGYKGKIVFADEVSATIQIFAKGNQQVTLQRDAITVVEDEAAMTRTARQGQAGPVQISFDEAMGQQFVNAQIDADGNPIEDAGRLTPVGGFDADLENVDAMWLDQGN